jgi:hypothetical protein
MVQSAQRRYPAVACATAICDWVFTLFQVELTAPAIPLKAVIVATTSKAAIKPYSTAVAALMSRFKLVSIA